MSSKLLYPELSYKIIGLAMEVHSTLGPGFLEKVYQNAMMVILREHGIPAEQEVPLKVPFHGHIVGDYRADIFVDNKIIIEAKTVKAISVADKAQAINYLKATGITLSILLNFANEKLQYQRVVFEKVSH
jgi:GxxExxY protein